AEMVTAMDPRRMPRMLRELPRPLAERVQDYLTELTVDQLSAVKGLRTRLALMAESAAGPFLEPAHDGGAQIDLRAALCGDPVIVFSLNSGRYPGLAAQIGTMVIQDLVSATGERLAAANGAPVPHALVGIDEFSALGADHLIGLVARGREPGLSV